MRLQFIIPSEKAPEKLLANFEILDAPLPGLKISEGAVWQGEKGPWVAFNGRQYESQGKKKSVRFISAVGDNRAAWDKFEAAIIQQFNKWADAQEAAAQAAGPAADSNPFA